MNHALKMKKAHSVNIGEALNGVDFFDFTIYELKMDLVRRGESTKFKVKDELIDRLKGVSFASCAKYISQ